MTLEIRCPGLDQAPRVARLSQWDHNLQLLGEKGLFCDEI